MLFPVMPVLPFQNSDLDQFCFVLIHSLSVKIKNKFIMIWLCVVKKSEIADISSGKVELKVLLGLYL